MPARGERCGHGYDERTGAGIDQRMVAKHVSYTSTLPAPETLTPERAEGTQGARSPSLKTDFENAYQRMNAATAVPA